MDNWFENTGLWTQVHHVDPRDNEITLDKICKQMALGILLYYILKFLQHYNERLVANSLRFKLKFTEDATCKQCREDDETVIHILRHCSKAKPIWKEVLNPAEQVQFNVIPDEQLFKLNLQGSFNTTLNISPRGRLCLRLWFRLCGSLEIQVSLKEQLKQNNGFYFKSSNLAGS